MLNRILTELGRRAWPHLSRTSPWGSGLGLARTILALGTLGTVATTPPQFLLSPLASGIVPPVCGEVSSAGLWCAIPVHGGEAARWISVAVLALVASGWRPRLTAIPHWYISWSLIANVTVQDGGDQITAVLTLLLVPVCLFDRRRWHWQPGPAGSSDFGVVVARAALLLAQIQIAVLYFQAAVAKLGVQEWADGTALYYWLHHPVFGAPAWLAPAVDFLSDRPVLLAVATWSSIAVELALAAAILLRPAAKRVMLGMGLLFHDAIAVTMGLVSFDMAMTGALLIYLLPVGQQVRPPRWLSGSVLSLSRRLGM